MFEKVKKHQRTLLSSLIVFCMACVLVGGVRYLLDQKGDILLWSVPAIGKQVYSNVFDALMDTHNPQEDIDKLIAALNERDRQYHF